MDTFEVLSICRKVQKKIRQVRQFVNRTGGGVWKETTTRECGCGERKTSRRREMKGEESPRRTIRQPFVLSIASTVREKQGLSPCSGQSER